MLTHTKRLAGGRPAWTDVQRLLLNGAWKISFKKGLLLRPLFPLKRTRMQHSIKSRFNDLFSVRGLIACMSGGRVNWSAGLICLNLKRLLAARFGVGHALYRAMLFHHLEWIWETRRRTQIIDGQQTKWAVMYNANTAHFYYFCVHKRILLLCKEFQEVSVIVGFLRNAGWPMVNYFSEYLNA